MMKDTLQEKNALYGRFAVTIKLNELNYLEAAKFYPDKPPMIKRRTMPSLVDRHLSIRR